MNREPMQPFHRLVFDWCIFAFGKKDATNKAMRNHRFTEEAVELVQSLGCTKEEVLRVVDYVYGRPAGNPVQEVGGSLVTLAALCAANGIDLDLAGDMELQRCWDRVEIIRSKHAAKPAFQAEPVPLLPSITEDGFLNEIGNYPVNSKYWTSLSIGSHGGCVFILTKMEHGDDVKHGQRLIEFLKNARIPA